MGMRELPGAAPHPSLLQAQPTGRVLMNRPFVRGGNTAFISSAAVREGSSGRGSSGRGRQGGGQRLQVKQGEVGDGNEPWEAVR